MPEANADHASCRNTYSALLRDILSLPALMMFRQPKDYNAFGYNPNGKIANTAGLLFGPS